MMKYIFLFLAVLNFSSAAFADADLDYYRQFIYHQEIDDTDPESPVTMTRYLMSEPFLKVALPSGDSINPVVNVFLYDNFTFRALYSENLFPKGSTGGFFPKGCRDIKGTWSVQNGKLMLPGVGFGERALDNGQNAVAITINQQIISPEIVNTKTVSAYGFSNITDTDARCFPF